MQRQSFELATVLAALALGGSAAGAEPDPARQTARPLNFVFFLVDDLGWRDTGCFGSTFYETPNIDRLAAQGMRFTDAYAACAGLLADAGQHHDRQVSGAAAPDRLDPGRGRLAVAPACACPTWRQYLPLEEVTIAKALKPAGYVSASIGKWHLGGPAYYPEHHGFDLNIAGSDIGHPPSYFWPYEGRSNSVCRV